MNYTLLIFFYKNKNKDKKINKHKTGTIIITMVKINVLFVFCFCFFHSVGQISPAFGYKSVPKYLRTVSALFPTFYCPCPYTCSTFKWQLFMLIICYRLTSENALILCENNFCCTL